MADRFKVAGAGNWTNTNTAIWAATSGGAAGASAPTSTDDVYCDAASGAGALTVAAGAACKSLKMRGTGGASDFTGAFAGSTALTISDGDLVLSPSSSRTYTGGLTFASTSGTTRSITSNGITLASAVTFNGVGGVFAIADTFLTTGGVTLTNGSLSAVGLSVTSATFNTNNNNTRSLDITNTTWTLTGTGTVFTTGNTTGLTLTAPGSLVDMTNASASSKTFVLGPIYTLGDVKASGAGTGSYTFGTSATPTFRDLIIANTGGATVTIQHDTPNIRNLNCTGFTGTLMSSTDAKTLMVSGNITFSAGMTLSSVVGNRLRFETVGTSGTQNITSAGKAFPISFKVNGAGGTTSLVDAFVDLSTFSVLKGTFLANGQSMTLNQFFSTGTDTRTVNLDGITVTLNGVNTVWTMFDPTGLTFSNVGTTIEITDGSATQKGFNGGGQSYNHVKYGGAGGVVSSLTVTGSNTWGTFEITNPPQNVVWESSSTQTFTTITLPFVAGSFGSFTASPPAAEAVLSKLNGVVLTDYLNLTDMKLTGGALWFMGQHSVGSGLIDGARFANRYFSSPPAQYW